MIRFFRTLRQKLLAENRVSRYLLYALGEITLLVLGILFALQIDNWNEARLDRKASLTFYANTRQQLQEDRQNLEGQIQYNNKSVDQFRYAIEVIAQGDRSVVDSLSALATKLPDYSDFNRQGNIYETIVTSGEIRLMQNNEIKKRLRQLEETYLYVNRMESIHLEAILGMMPDLLEVVNMTTGKAIDQERLYSGPFQNKFAISLGLIAEKDQVYHRALDEIDAVTELMDSEIKNLKSD